MTVESQGSLRTRPELAKVHRCLDRWVMGCLIAAYACQAQGRRVPVCSCPFPLRTPNVYDEGASLAQLASQTGLGRARLRAELRAAGVDTRSAGHTTAAGRPSRAVAADAEAAVRVGTDDLIDWLQTRRTEGWTLAALGRAVGHSSHWVKWRLLPADEVAPVAETGPDGCLPAATLNV